MGCSGEQCGGNWGGQEHESCLGAHYMSARRVSQTLQIESFQSKPAGDHGIHERNALDAMDAHWS